MTGRVYLVGAGPGDPELLTLKALRILRLADVVLHDELVSPAILALVRPAARVVNVGKRCDFKRVSQDQISALMVAYASAGQTVVRLKGGDPMIFGRAEEEMAALRAAGTQFEVVPGITAALGAAAAAQVPLTKRGVAPALLFVTYSRLAGQPPLNWRALAASGATIVIYMPGSEYGSISAELCAAGLNAETPCVIVSRASRNNQTVLASTVQQLSGISAQPAPALLIVGWVADSVARTAEIRALEEMHLVHQA
ncbi:MAG TPA: uroporphyrinogen-III C-methyltransferase [Candidatus Angelobacter sp.]|nr:uroporphyrinogen-III C-methyltransferase [Candidatus Angelobacter sp.]